MSVKYQINRMKTTQIGKMKEKARSEATFFPCKVIRIDDAYLDQLSSVE